MASGRKPRLSLPPELSAIDEAWGNEEQPTVPRPSRAPTAPVRQDTPEIILTAPPPTGIELEALEEEWQEKATKVPQIPLDEYARRMMTEEAQQAVTEVPPPFDRALEFDLSIERNEHFGSQEPSTAVSHPSQVPTAPPPAGAYGRGSYGGDPPLLRRSPAPNDMEFDLASELPPPISGASMQTSSIKRNVEVGHRTMKDKFAMGDFSGALEIAEKLLEKSPSDPEARSLSEKCREVLLDMYSSRISGPHQVPRIVMGPDQIRWLSLDHRAGFMLSMIDGISSVDDLLDVSGMQRLDALRILCSLMDQKVIELG